MSSLPFSFEGSMKEISRRKALAGLLALPALPAVVAELPPATISPTIGVSPIAASASTMLMFEEYVKRRLQAMYEDYALANMHPTMTRDEDGNITVSVSGTLVVKSLKEG